MPALLTVDCSHSPVAQPANQVKADLARFSHGRRTFPLPSVNRKIGQFHERFERAVFDYHSLDAFVDRFQDLLQNRFCRHPAHLRAEPNFFRSWPALLSPLCKPVVLSTSLASRQTSSLKSLPTHS